MEGDIFRIESLFIGYPKCRARQGTRGWGQQSGPLLRMAPRSSLRMWGIWEAQVDGGKCVRSRLLL